MMKHYKITVKEKGHDTPLTPHYAGNVTENDLIEFFGLREPDVEWYEIEEMAICSLCGAIIPMQEANNAEPIATGVCCPKCNIEKVVPKRISEIRNNYN